MIGQQYLPYVGCALFAIGIIGWLVTNRANIASWLSWATWRKSTSTVTAPAVDDDTLDFQAWNRLRKRKSFQNTESQAALKVLAANFVEVTP